MSFTIEVAESKSQMEEFLNLPYMLYKDDPFWVPNVKSFQREILDSTKHPFFKHASVTFFLTRDDTGKVVGTIAAIVNHAHNDYHKDKVGFFGFLECIENQGVFDLLLDTASANLKEQGMEQIRGPFNYSVNEECGMLVKGFSDSPRLMMTYNPPYYADMTGNAGFKGIKDLLAYSVDGLKADFSKVERIAKVVERRMGTVIRDIDNKNLKEEVPLIIDIFNECWKNNWGFVPMTELELETMAKELKMIIVPELSPIVEVDGKAVGFAVGLPDVNKAFKKANGNLLRLILALKVPPFKVHPKWVRVTLLGVREEYRGRGLEAILIDRVIKESEKRGITMGEMSWILEDNVPMRAILEKSINADAYRTYRIFERSL